MPYNTHQNSVAERLNRNLMELVRSMLDHASMEKHFWVEALSVAFLVRNRVTSKELPVNVTAYLSDSR